MFCIVATASILCFALVRYSFIALEAEEQLLSGTRLKAYSLQMVCSRGRQSFVEVHRQLLESLLREQPTNLRKRIEKGCIEDDFGLSFICLMNVWIEFK